MRDLLICFLEPLEARTEMFASAEDFLAAYDRNRAGCLLLDIRLPGMDGLSLYAWLQARGSIMPVIFLTGYADVATARQVLMSGAADFLQKPVERRVLLDSVNAAFEVNRRQQQEVALTARLSYLTPREWDVMRLVVAGKPNKLIGSELGISQKTVEAHRARVMGKTRAGSVADLVRMFTAFEQMPGARQGQEDDTLWRRAQ
jgi:FixJ family two-component response regulator